MLFVGTLIVDTYRYITRHKSKGVMWWKAKIAVSGPAAFIENGVRALFPKEVLYADEMYKGDKLKQLDLKNKEGNT